MSRSRGRKSASTSQQRSVSETSTVSLGVAGPRGRGIVKRDGLDSSLARLVGTMLLGAAIAVCGVAMEAQAEIFYYQDADGVFHFSNVAQPNSLPFDLKPAEQAEAE